MGETPGDTGEQIIRHTLDQGRKSYRAGGTVSVCFFFLVFAGDIFLPFGSKKSF